MQKFDSDLSTSSNDILTRVRTSILLKLNCIVSSYEKIEVESAVEIIQIFCKTMNSHPQVFDKNCIQKALGPLTRLSISSNVYLSRPDFISQICELVSSLLHLNRSVDLLFIQKILDFLVSVSFARYNSFRSKTCTEQSDTISAHHYYHSPSTDFVNNDADSEKYDTVGLFEQIRFSKPDDYLICIDGLLQLMKSFSTNFQLTPIQLLTLLRVIKTLFIDHICYFAEPASKKSILALNLVLHCLETIPKVFKQINPLFEFFEPFFSVILICIDMWNKTVKNLEHNIDKKSEVFRLTHKESITTDVIQSNDHQSLESMSIIPKNFHIAHLKILGRIEESLSGLLYFFSQYSFLSSQSAIFSYWPNKELVSVKLIRALFYFVSECVIPTKDSWDKLLAITSPFFENEKFGDSLTSLFVKFFEYTALKQSNTIASNRVVLLDKFQILGYWIDLSDKFGNSSEYTSEEWLEINGNRLLLTFRIIYQICLKDTCVLDRENINKIIFLICHTCKVIYNCLVEFGFNKGLSKIIRLMHQILLFLFQLHSHLDCTSDVWNPLNKIVAFVTNLLNTHESLQEYATSEEHLLLKDYMEYFVILCLMISLIFPKYKNELLISSLNSNLERVVAASLSILIRVMVDSDEYNRKSMLRSVRLRLDDSAHSSMIISIGLYNFLFDYILLLKSHIITFEDYNFLKYATLSKIKGSDLNEIEILSKNWLDNYFSSQLPSLPNWSDCYFKSFSCTEESWDNLRKWLLLENSLIDIIKLLELFSKYSDRTYRGVIARFFSAFWEYTRELDIVEEKNTAELPFSTIKFEMSNEQHSELQNAIDIFISNNLILFNLSDPNDATCYSYDLRRESCSVYNAKMKDMQPFSAKFLKFIIAYLFNLALNSDRSYFYLNLSALLASVGSKNTKLPINDLVVELVKHFASSSLSLNEWQVLIQIVECIACIMQDYYLEFFIVFLLKKLTENFLIIRKCALEAIYQISNYKKLSFKSLLMENRRILWIIVKEVQTNPHLLDEVCSCLLDQNLNSFFQEYGEFLIPKIFTSKYREKILQVISCSVDIKKLARKNIQPIFFAILCKGHDKYGTVKYLYHLVDLRTSIKQTFEKNKVFMLIKITIMLGNEETVKKAEKVLVYLIQVLELNVSPAEFLKDHFLRILNTIVHNYLFVPSVFLKDKKVLILGFRKLVEHVGPYLDYFYLKIIALFKTAMMNPGLRSEVCESFLYVLKLLPKKFLVSIFGQVTTHLLMHIDGNEDGILPILNYLFITEFDLLSVYFKDIPMIPDHPSLKLIAATWSNVTNRDKMSLLDQLQELSILITNEHEEIRDMALKKLYIFLCENRTQIVDYILVGKASNLISELMERLFVGSRTRSKSVRIQFSRCLGKLGAIDPGRLSVNFRMRNFEFYFDFKDLARLLIEKHLIKVYRTALSMGVQDQACCTIQNILKYFSRSNTNNDPCDQSIYKNDLWDELQPETQSIIYPFLSSSYIMDMSHVRRLQYPIYRSDMEYKDWIYLWMQKLILDSEIPFYQTCLSLPASPEINHFLLPHIVLSILQSDNYAIQKGIYIEILAVISNNQNPYVYINLMATQSVFDLIDCIFQWRYDLYRKLSDIRNHSSNIQGNQVELLNNKIKISDEILEKIPKLELIESAFASSAFSRALLYMESYIRNEIDENIAKDPPVEMEMAVLEYLEMVKKSREVIIAKYATNLQKIYVKLEDSDSILGLNSIRAENSVMDLIVHYQASRRWSEVLVVMDQILHANTDLEVVKNLQLIRLESLKELGLFDQILNTVKLIIHESKSHSRVYREEEEEMTHGLAPFNPPNYASLKRGSDQVDDSQRRFDLTGDEVFSNDIDLGNLDGRSSLKSSYFKMVRSHGVSAAWRLKDWNMMDQLLEEEQLEEGRYKDMNFDIGIGRILMALRRKDRSEFSNLILVLQNSLMQNLTLTSFESYERSYPIMIQLHILSDLENSWTLHYGKGELAGSRGGGGMDVDGGGGWSISPDEFFEIRNEIFYDWNMGLDLLSKLYTQREPILSLRIAEMEMCGLDASFMWLDLAKSSRKSGRREMTQYSLLKIRESLKFESKLHAAKLLWQDKRESLAFIEVNRIMEACLAELKELRSGKPIDPPFTSKNFSNPDQNRGNFHICIGSGLEGCERGLRYFLGLKGTDGVEIAANGGYASLYSKYLSNIYNRSVILATRWMQKMGYSTQSIISVYDQCCMNRPSGKLYYEYGTFLDRLACECLQSFKGQFFGDLANVDRVKSYWLYFLLALDQYSKSAREGPQYVDQIIPRFLKMCINAANAFEDVQSHGKPSKPSKPSKTKGQKWSNQSNAHKSFLHAFVVTGDNADFSHFSGFIQDFFSTWTGGVEGLQELIRMAHSVCLKELNGLFAEIPVNSWFVAYSLLISSCIHRNSDLSMLISRIILSTMLCYPERAMWTVVPMEANANRAERYQWFLQQLSNDEIADESASPLATADYFTSASRFINSLLMIFSWKPQKGKTEKVTKYQFSSAIPQLDTREIPECIMVPTESQLNGIAVERDYVKIRGFGKDILVLSSKQKPRRIEILGSDGRLYPFLCKAGDDIRRDARMMEFNTLVNKLLKKDIETRRRQLKIRTYSVVALRERMGLFGWVMNTNSFKELVAAMMSLEGKNLGKILGRLICEFWQKNSHKEPDWVHTYVTKVLPMVPSVFWKWFVVSFPDPSTFLRMRTNYTRTTAVMSIVGAILGLGDRHCENIMLDTATGDCVHVDLNCIFYQGLELEVPEVVPFRLTPNMVDAFGVLGYEGCFRHACELTMRKLRENKNTLISVLETLMHDPFECQSQSSHAKKKPSNEHRLKEILEILNSVSDRIEGVKGSPYLTTSNESLFPLSVEVHVDTLIKEATSVERLSKMYVGWNPFI